MDALRLLWPQCRDATRPRENCAVLEYDTSTKNSGTKAGRFTVGQMALSLGLSGTVKIRCQAHSSYFGRIPVQYYD